MVHVLKVDDFSLSFCLHMVESDLHLPANATLRVSVESNGFAGKTDMDTDVEEFAGFAECLQRIYETLRGEAEIIDLYGERVKITFHGDGRGHVYVSGVLRDQGHVLEFDHTIDQTDLGEFCQRLKNTYGKYLIK